MMMTKKEAIITTITGIIFLIFGIAAILNALFILHNPSIILWLCHIGLILLGIGFLTKNKILVDSQINILAIPLVVWSADFLQFLFTGNSILGITSYFFQQGELTSKIITSQHLFTIPLAVFSRIYIKDPTNTKRSILISLATIIPVFIISRILGPEENINNVFTFVGIQNNYYPIIWFLVVFLAIILTNKLLNLKKIY